jgi:hypothetical protein
VFSPISDEHTQEDIVPEFPQIVNWSKTGLNRQYLFNQYHNTGTPNASY